MLNFKIIVDWKENPKKCTILPNEHREDFHIQRFPKNLEAITFHADCLLHVNGVCLSQIKRDRLKSLGLIDCHWNRVEKIISTITNPLPILIKIPSDFVTAYPRKSKDQSDPSGGLATIEALFIASCFLGKKDKTLLDNYHFKDDFLEKNRLCFEKYQLS